MRNRNLSSIFLTVVTLLFVGIVCYTQNLNQPLSFDLQQIETTETPYPYFLPPIQYNCENFAAQLPESFDIIAAGSYSGIKTPYQIDDSGDQAHRYDVKVQHSKPLVLVLTAHDPNIWQIAWEKNTKIVGVIATGYQHQVVTGLPKEIPILVTSLDSGECNNIYEDEIEPEKINRLTQKILQRDIQLAVPADGEHIIVGKVDKTTTLLSSDDITLEDVINPDLPLAGPAGIQDAVSKGLLRPATEADLKRISFYVNMEYVHLHSSYVVLAPMQVPAGLYGAHSVSFLVPKGVPKPVGNLGHSEVYHLN